MQCIFGPVSKRLTIFMGLAAFGGIMPVAMAEPPVLDVPVVCEIGTACIIHKYMDHDPGPGRRDYACGRLSRDGDTGADFRVANYPAMQRGVAVIAAADGTVRARRDGMADVSVRETGAGVIKGREAGNAVVLTHGDGWETQYSHLRRGSVRVEEGQFVAAGTALGLIGLSGNTEFPHVEFSLRHHGKAVDPFVGVRPVDDDGTARPYQCGMATASLWSPAAQARLGYVPTGVLSAGFATGPADPETARHGRYDPVFSARSPAIVFWVDIFGAETGDQQRIRIIGPGGGALVDSQSDLEANNIAWFAFAGKKRPDAGWPAGSYRATYQLVRDHKIVAEIEKTMTIKE